MRAQRKDELTRQLRTVEHAAKELREIDAQLSQIRIKPKMVDDLDVLDRQIASLDAQLSAAAAQLAVEVKPEGLGQVRIAGNRTSEIRIPKKYNGLRYCSSGKRYPRQGMDNSGHDGKRKIFEKRVVIICCLNARPRGC